MPVSNNHLESGRIWPFIVKQPCKISGCMKNAKNLNPLIVDAIKDHLILEARDRPEPNLMQPWVIEGPMSTHQWRRK
jgi:hypothetical protein